MERQAGVRVDREAGPIAPRRRALVARRQRRAAAVAGAAFVLVLLAVSTGATQALDQAAVDRLRPDFGWGPPQQRLLPINFWFEPRRAYLLLGLVTAVVCLWRLSWRPAVFAVLVAGTSMGVTAVTKVVTHRPGPAGDIAATGGSFPSGHMVALLVCLGCCVLVTWRRTRWWQWALVAVPSAMMAAALSYTATHWVTDVLGGALLALATIFWAASWRLRTAMTEPRPVAGSGASVDTGVDTPGDEDPLDL